jgi:hypothetical protein
MPIFSMLPFDIFSATFQWNGCDDMRPWLIVDVRPEQRYGCFPISSAAYAGSCFPLDPEHPDFSATGLKKACYIHDSKLVELPAACFNKQRGVLTGELLAQFRDYAGV